jgi:hypothetical protein
MLSEVSRKVGKAVEEGGFSWKLNDLMLFFHKNTVYIPN